MSHQWFAEINKFFSLEALQMLQHGWDVLTLLKVTLKNK